MADIDREFRMNQEMPDRACYGAGFCYFLKITDQVGTLRPLGPLFQFDTDNRLLLAGDLNSDQGTAPDKSMTIKKGFTGNGKQGFPGTNNPLAFASAEPDAALFITITK